MGEDIFESIKPEEIELPLTVLNGYAESFNIVFLDKLVFEIKKTMEQDNDDPWGSIVIGGSNKEKEEKNLVTRVFIVAPGLSNYRLFVLKLTYKISLVYPCRIESILDDFKHECKDANELKGVLEQIFKSDSFQRPVKMLLSQLMQ